MHVDPFSVCMMEYKVGRGACRVGFGSIEGYIFFKIGQYAFPCTDVPSLGLFPFLSLAPAAVANNYMGLFTVRFEGDVDIRDGGRGVHGLLVHVWALPLEAQACPWLDLNNLAAFGALVVVV